LLNVIILYILGFDTQLFLSPDVMILQYCRHAISTRSVQIGDTTFRK